MAFEVRKSENAVAGKGVVLTSIPEFTGSPGAGRGVAVASEPSTVTRPVTAESFPLESRRRISNVVGPAVEIGPAQPMPMQRFTPGKVFPRRDRSAMYCGSASAAAMTFESLAATDWPAADADSDPNMLSSFSPREASCEAGDSVGLSCQERSRSAETVGSSMTGRMTPTSS